MSFFKILKSKFQNPNSRKGFTLIEILVTIAIITGVFGVVITSAAAIQRNSRDAKRQADLRIIQGALQQYYADNQFFPRTLDLSDGNNGSFSNSGIIYLQSLPKDPQRSTKAYCYVSYRSDGATACDNTSANLSDRCYKYQLFAALENVPTPAMTGNLSCTTTPATTFNYYITPN